MDGEFLAAMDAACRKVDQNRSQFIRAAVRARLEREHGIVLEDAVTSAPRRTGKTITSYRKDQRRVKRQAGSNSRSAAGALAKKAAGE
jgi:metal-responsive CopG/Arc/MetJ family transcriptional regulator